MFVMRAGDFTDAADRDEFAGDAQVRRRRRRRRRHRRRHRLRLRLRLRLRHRHRHRHRLRLRLSRRLRARLRRRRRLWQLRTVLPDLLHLGDVGVRPDVASNGRMSS